MANIFDPTFLKDLAERAAKTFVQTFAATFAVPADVFDASAWESAALGAVAAAISVATSLLSKAVGDPDSASLVK